MNVKEAIELLVSPRQLMLKGAHSGKMYYNSENNTLKTRQKYEGYECHEKPIGVIMKCTETMAYPCIVIWFMDYELCKNRSKTTVNSRVVIN